MNQDQARIDASNNLCRIAEAMEAAEPGSAFARELNRDYKANLEVVFPKSERKKNSTLHSEGAIKKSKDECYTKIVAALDDLAAWELKMGSLYIGQMGHIEFSYLVNYNSMAFEMQFMIPDAFYRNYAGCQAIKNRVNLFSVKQLEAYRSLEYGLIRFALDMIRGERRKWFWNKYAIPYNKRIEDKKNTAPATTDTIS